MVSNQKASFSFLMRLMLLRVCNVPHENSNNLPPVTAYPIRIEATRDFTVT